MANKHSKKKRKLIEEVYDLKIKLKTFGIKNAKAEFFDTAYGKMFKKESMRLDNVWGCLIADEVFVNRLTKFVNKQEENAH